MERKVVSGLMLSLLLIGMLTLAFNVQLVKATGTIYIRADGSVDPPTAPISSVDNVTYTFTGDINDSVVVERNNTVVDGAGYTLQGTGSGKGIDLSGRSNVTIKNMKITTFVYGIWLNMSSNNVISGNNIKNNWSNIYLLYSSNNIVIGNNITNSDYGIILGGPSNSNNITRNNIINNHIAIELGSSYNSIIGNNITNNLFYGIKLAGSSYNNMYENNIAGNERGILLMSSSNSNCIYGNNITNNTLIGIQLYPSSNNNNSIYGNNITNNYYGIWLSHSSNSEFYHNNIINNLVQVSSEASMNLWDDGYPSGGNYWSNYNGTDLYCGPYQNESGSDGIGDTPYFIDENNADRYPLMEPWTPSEEVPYVFSRTATYSWSDDYGPVWGPNTVPFSDRFGILFGQPDAGGVIDLMVPKESYHCEPAYDPVGGATGPFTWQLNMTSDGYGKLYTINGTGDVDINSMTNDTGTYFRKDGAWHPAGEEWIGDGTLDPAGSSWLCLPLIVSVYEGNGTSGRLYGTFRLDFWLTTGFSNNRVVETASRLNDFYMNETGVPFNRTSGVVTYVETNARLNIPWVIGPLDLQHKAVRSGAPSPALMVTLFSPANLYVTDPQYRHIGTNPKTGKAVNEIPGAFYSGPGSEPQRIIIPNPLDGVYDVEIVGTSTGSYTLVVELATPEKTTTHTYTSNVSVGQVLESQATVSEGEMTVTPPGPGLGDANSDGHVNLLDLSMMAHHWFNTPTYDSRVDFNMDGFINLSDLSILADHWFKGPKD